MKIRIPAGILAALLFLAAGCATQDRSPDGATSATTGVSGRATVFAAASLTESFNGIAELFKAANPETELTFNFGPSSGLATQILEQGGADVFASADQTNMEKVSADDLIDGDPQVFARNVLQIIVAPGNPKGIRTLSDLANPDLKVVLAAAQVPVGRYARQALDKAGVTVNPVSEAVDVKGVVGPVTLGEADAGVVYATDVRAVGSRAAGIEIPEQHNVEAEYPIGVVGGADNPEVARAFVDFVLSRQGREVLSEHGFLDP
ncbi:MAG TPA: molybdate ABC transporter substrate-binding protein [Actinomycetota bacterium]|nr:molybdate ABC transporter substrate-binding protein [Actinomycetota bacterium]